MVRYIIVIIKQECYNKRIPSNDDIKKHKEEKNNSIAYCNIKKIQTKSSDNVYSDQSDLLIFITLVQLEVVKLTMVIMMK